MKSIAFYLPQFHTIPENDQWWGKGFTEWTNVKKAKPFFKGHNQPQIPSELGYYDLRNNQVRHQQISLAKEYGIDAFCYYHYWFCGKQLLETPLKMMLNDKECDFPFCLCWANETWSRAWDGREKEILIQQEYNTQDYKNHAQYLCEIFKDSRYLKIDGKPIFIVYRVGRIPNAQEFIQTFTDAAISAGFSGLRIFSVRNSSCDVPEKTLNEWGIFDIIDFEPNSADFPYRSPLGKSIRFFQRKWNTIARKFHFKEIHSVLKISYKKNYLNILKNYDTFSENHYPTVFPNWDNSPRRKEATIIQNENPEDFYTWVKSATQIVKKRPPENQFLFINAWNEWAESAHLEPESIFDKAFLEAFKKGISE